MAVMKLVYLTPLYFHDRSCVGGGERYPLNLARGVLTAAPGRVEVELLSYGEEPLVEALQPGLTLRVLRAVREPENPLDVLSWELPSAVAAADLVHIHQAFTRSSEMGLLVARQQRKPVCITDHGGNTSTLGLQLDALRLADCVVCYSQFAASLLHTGTRVEIIRGGVDGEHFAPPPVRPRRDRVLYVGRLLPHKGIDRLIEALPPQLPLTVCGRPYDKKYFRLLRRLAAGKRVEFVLDADDALVRALYARAWCCVLPSVYRDCFGGAHRAPELMGFTLLEAMACGTPAVCANVAAMPEFVRPGETGFVFDDVRQLREQLRRLAGDPDLVERLGRQARRTVEREYDLKVAGARLLALYEGLISRTKEGAA